MDKQHTPKKASQGDWHPADVKAALEKAGWTLRKLAALHNIFPHAINVALRRRCLPAETRIADALGVHPMVIWPSRFNADGSRLMLKRGAGAHGNVWWKRKLHSNAATARVNDSVTGAK